MGYEARREAGAGDRFDAGGEGGRGRIRGGRGVVIRVEGAGYDSLRQDRAQVYTWGKSRGRTRGRHDQWAGHCRAWLVETDFDAAASAGERGPDHARTGAGSL